MLYIILFLILITGLTELICLSRNKQWEELLVVGVLLLISLVYDISLILDLNLPTLKDGMELAFTPVTNYLEGIFN